MDMKDVGNIKTGKGTWYKVFWDKITLAVHFKKSQDNNLTHLAPSARNELDAKKFAKNEADQIES